MCDQLTQGSYLTVPRLGVDIGTFWSPVSFVTIKPLIHTMDGCILRCGIISSCQSAATSKIVKRF